MGAWIEISLITGLAPILLCRTPRWVRGLKFTRAMCDGKTWRSRTPRWVRGLKLTFITPII